MATWYQLALQLFGLNGGTPQAVNTDGNGNLQVNLNVNGFPVASGNQVPITGQVQVIDASGTRNLLTTPGQSGANTAGVINYGLVRTSNPGPYTQGNVDPVTIGTDGSIWATIKNTVTVSIPGNVAVFQGTASNLNAWAQSIPSATAAACSVDREAALSNTPILVKNSGGRLYGYNYFNPGSALAYVHLYDAATTGAVTVGTTVPTLSFPLPSNASASIGDETISPIALFGFQNGIVIAASTTPNGGTAPVTALFAQTYYA